MSPYISMACLFLLVVFHEVRRLLHVVVKMYTEKELKLKFYVPPERWVCNPCFSFSINYYNFNFLFYAHSHKTKKSYVLLIANITLKNKKNLDVCTYERGKKLIMLACAHTKKCFYQSEYSAVILKRQRVSLPIYGDSTYMSDCANGIKICADAFP